MPFTLSAQDARNVKLVKKLNVMTVQSVDAKKSVIVETVYYVPAFFCHIPEFSVST